MWCVSTSCLVVRCSLLTVVVSFKTSTESRILTSVTHLISFVMPFAGVTTPFITGRGPSSPCFSTVFTVPLPLENAGVWPVGSDGELNEVAEIPWLAAGEKKWKSEHCWHVMYMVNKWVFSPTYKWDILGIIGVIYLWIRVRLWRLVALPETNSSPLEICRCKKETSLTSNHLFSMDMLVT